MSITKFFALMRAVDEHHLVCFVCTPMSHAVVVAPDGVYTDGVHMQSWNVSVLHTFAQKMGLKRDWFQEEGVRFRGRGAEVSNDHYDLTTTAAYHRARAAGALYLPSRIFAQKFPLYRRRKGLVFDDYQATS